MMMGWLQSSIGCLVLTSGLLGLCVGSFLNVVICRLPIMIISESNNETTGFNLCFPSSHCPRCGRVLAVRDNIPLLSYLCRKGRCRYCNGMISLRYPLVEGTMAALFSLLALFTGWHYSLLGLWGLSSMLVALAVIDVEYMLLPDQLTLSLLWLGLLFNLDSAGFVALPLAISGAVCGYLFFRLVEWIARQLFQRDALGMGDAKFLAALGAWLGVAALPWVVLLAASLTLISYLTIWRFRSIRTAPQIPFGPGLAVAGLIVAFCQR
ncbi:MULTISPECIES: prepilin peptidase [Photorhabdus]|uniref:Prepilin leader peptidase/N-methyltransferase n=2 Tax=Photorhabdus asymbiotica TaxID=291112 RepID=C7BQ99_PHOAA|nr:A24 family peptidase [Photorhabdus asymbiotica]RKS56757.1 type 4 prepilin peptidase 1 [Photorhabdus asymbiotica]CAQ84874.1 type 4 prepilin-like proteins leader peptide processing enzyme (pecti enzymes secretion protein outo) [Photorhabdus asymbiotica]